VIQKRNLEACEHACEYWKQNRTHAEADRRTCLDLATRLIALLKAKAPASEFLALELACEQARIDELGHGGFGLHSAVIAILSDLGA
jgi:hypothetical protein